MTCVQQWGLVGIGKGMWNIPEIPIPSFVKRCVVTVHSFVLDLVRIWKITKYNSCGNLRTLHLWNTLSDEAEINILQRQLVYQPDTARSNPTVNYGFKYLAVNSLNN